MAYQVYGAKDGTIALGNRMGSRGSSQQRYVRFNGKMPCTHASNKGCPPLPPAPLPRLFVPFLKKVVLLSLVSTCSSVSSVCFHLLLPLLLLHSAGHPSPPSTTVTLLLCFGDAWWLSLYELGT